METFEEATYQERMALAALDYLEYGFSIVPTHIGAISNGRFICTCGSSTCGKSAGKHPAVPWKRYQYFRPTARQIISWAVDFPGYNIGAVHGKASGTVVLDWDGDDGWESRHQLERELGELPATPTIITGSGGEHQVFRHPGRHIPTNKGLRPGFDVRGDGGFSVLPPSRHYLGRTYEWDVDQHIDDLPLAILPAAWIGFIAKSSSSPLPCDTSTRDRLDTRAGWHATGARWPRDLHAGLRLAGVLQTGTASRTPTDTGRTISRQRVRNTCHAPI